MDSVGVGCSVGDYLKLSISDRPKQEFSKMAETEYMVDG
jgi:hypothetical protein